MLKLLVKKKQAFWVETFSIYQFHGSTPSFVKLLA